MVALTCNPSTWEKDQKFKAIYRTHQVGDKAGHIRHRLIKNKTTNTSHDCRDLERIIWKIKTIHVSAHVYMYVRATVPVVDCKGSENWSLDVLSPCTWVRECFFTSLCLRESMPCTWCQQRPEGTWDPLEQQSVQVEVTWLSPGNWTPILQKRTKQQLPFGHCIFHFCKCFRGWTMCNDLTRLGKWLSG